MFIKKDLRKIPRILADAAVVQEPPTVAPEDGGVEPPANKRPKTREFLKELRLSRRQAEFKDASLSILCQPKNIPSLRHLMSLSLYDCQISSLEGIGMLGSSPDGTVCCPDLRDLNVGRNPIKTLPDELALLGNSLKELFCDDCTIDGAMPSSIFQLQNLETLRLSNNNITSIPTDIESLENLRTLCLDRNQITILPPEMSKLSNLESLMLRHNQIQSLPDGLPGESMASLRLLHVSSNQLTSLPDSLVYCTSLQTIYVNSNQISRLPVGLAIRLTNLKRLNVSHNKIERLATDFVNRFGQPSVTDGTCSKDDGCLALVDQNPVIERMKQDAVHQDMNAIAMNGSKLISAA